MPTALAPVPPPPVAVESFPFSWVTPKPAPLPASFPFSYESWTPPPPLNQLFVLDGWNGPTAAAVLGFGLAAAAVSTAGAMRSGGKDGYAHQGGYPPQGLQQGGYPGQQGQQQGYPPPQGQQGQGQQRQGSYQQGQQGQQGQWGQGQQGGYVPQDGSLGSAASPVIPDGAHWAPSAPMGTPGNPDVGTTIGTPAVNPGNPAAARREAAASVDELLDLMHRTIGRIPSRAFSRTTRRGAAPRRTTCHLRVRRRWSRRQRRRGVRARMSPRASLRTGLPKVHGAPRSRGA